MIFDVAYKFARKSLSQSLYDFISFDLLRRRTRYERWETYRDIIAHYRSRNLDFQGRAVAEIGCGRQYYTALGFLAAGAARVHMVEPKLAFSPDILAQHLRTFNDRMGTSLDLEAMKARITCHPDTSAFPPAMDAGIDLICSFTVLEHVRDLASFFADTARLLRAGGLAYHMVDVSDHTYQVFARWSLGGKLNHYRALYHLRYSPRFYRFLNDEKCHMNRELLPAYLKLAEENRLEVLELETAPYAEPVSIHPGVLERAGAHPDPGHLHVTSFSLKLRKRDPGG